MRVLITNNTLADRAGSELYVRDIALALLRRGHQPVAYSTRLGAVADELRAATVPVIDDLSLLTVAPDVIHGQHHLDAMTAMLYFPDTPSVYFCHGWVPWEEMAPRFPTIQRYVAVDDLCRERLQCTHGIPPERICMVRNFYDPRRHVLRDNLPAVPRRALVLSNQMREAGSLGILRQACAARGIALDAVGLGVGHVAANPEQILGQYDIVFGKARSALEALACGTAVIACDAAGLGGMVTPDNYDTLRSLNFGIRCLRDPITVDGVVSELDRYNPAQAREVSLRARAEADIDQAVEQILAVYREAIEAPRNWSDSKAPHLRQAGDYLRQVADTTKERHEAERLKELAKAETTTQRLRAEEAERHADQLWLQAKETEKQLATIHNLRIWPLVIWIYRLKHALFKRPLFPRKSTENE